MKRPKYLSVTGMIIGMIFIVTIMGFAHYFIAKRAYQGILFIFPSVNVKIYIGVVTFFTLVTVLGFVRSMLPLPVTAKNIIGGISMYWMGIFIYLFVLFVTAEGILTIGKLLKLIPVPVSVNIRFYSMITVGVLTAVIVCYGIYNARRIEMVSYEVKMDCRELKGDLNMVLISDLHLGALGSEERIMKAVDEINRLNPDVVCIAGDIFDNDYYSIKNPEQVAECLRSIRSKYGVYACLGNHDAGKTVDKLIEFVRFSDIKLLNDEAVVIDNRFTLVGRLDGMPIGNNGGQDRKETEDVLKDVDKMLPVIVMDHNPQNIEEYGNNVDLVVSGHTHKGQLFPANFITGIMYTVDYGYYRKDSISPHIIVTSGLGTWGMPMRVGSSCEIVNIKLD